MNNNKIKIFLKKPILQFVILPSLIVLIAAFFLTKNLSTSILLSILISIIGWLNTFNQGVHTFSRTETSKYRDAISKDIDAFFDDLDSKFEKRSLKETELEDYLAGKVTILELRIKHIKTRTSAVLLSDSDLSRLRSNPIDILTSMTYKSDLTEMRFKYLETVEINYSKWLYSMNKLM